MRVIKEKCRGCGACVEVCPVSAISKEADGNFVIDNTLCLGCCCCLAACPNKAIEMD